MIVDCHSHIWLSRNSLGKANSFSTLANSDACLASPELHTDSMEPADISFVLGFVSRRLNAEIPNEAISKYIASDTNRLIGFAGVDPAEPSSKYDLKSLRDDQHFAGVTLSPACQGFHPCDTRAMQLYEQAAELEMPVYFLQGGRLPEQAILEYAQPVMLDEVARVFPTLKIIISHLGYPWIEQAIALLAKHENIFANVAGLTDKPWQALRSLTLAYEYGVVEKLLFGSGFPCYTVKQTIESLYNLNKISGDSIIAAVPREQLRGIIERDSIELLGLSKK